MTTPAMHPQWPYAIKSLANQTAVIERQRQEQARAEIVDWVLADNPGDVLEAFVRLDRINALQPGRRSETLRNAHATLLEMTAVLAAYGASVILDEIQRRFEE